MHNAAGLHRTERRVPVVDVTLTHKEEEPDEVLHIDDGIQSGSLDLLLLLLPLLHEREFGLLFLFLLTVFFAVIAHVCFSLFCSLGGLPFFLSLKAPNSVSMQCSNADNSTHWNDEG